MHSHTNPQDSTTPELRHSASGTEHCLYCGDPLPPLLPDGTRPSPWCSCGSPIAAPPGFSIRELCPVCAAPVPVHGYNVKRFFGKCAECHTQLPSLDVNAPLKWLPPDSELQSLASAPSNSPSVQNSTPLMTTPELPPPAPTPPSTTIESSGISNDPAPSSPSPPLEERVGERRPTAVSPPSPLPVSSAVSSFSASASSSLVAPDLPSEGGLATPTPGLHEPIAPILVPLSTINSQPSITFPRLSDPRIIKSIGTPSLNNFFTVFAKELAAKNIAIPDHIPDISVHAEVCARLFSAPDLLPQPLVDALLAIQEFASPKNKRLLEKLAADANLDTSLVPEGWAMRLWLKAPFDLQYIKTLQAHLPENFYDGDIEYCDPDEDQTDSSPSASASSSSSLATPKPPGEGGPIVEINPCPRNRIARLPKEVRDSINRMLGQGLTYAEILKQLGEHAHGLNKSSLSRWKRGPYQAWLKHQQRLEESGAQLKFALEAVRHNENNQIHQATQQIAALRISELFSQLDLPALKEAIIEDPATLVRLAQLLPKLSQGGLQCERQRHELAHSKPAAPDEKPRGPIKRGLSNKALRYIQQRLHLM